MKDFVNTLGEDIETITSDILDQFHLETYSNLAKTSKDEEQSPEESKVELSEMKHTSEEPSNIVFSY
mgnify:CR=1 FL=1